MTNWINAGDIDPRQGTTLFDLDSVELTSESFTVNAIEVTPESQVGGSEKVFALTEGNVFLNTRDVNSALDAIGAKLVAGHIVTQDGSSPDGETRYPIRSADGLLILASAAEAYAGIEDVNIRSTISIGLPDHLDQTRKFPDTPIYYRSNSNLWAVMRAEIDGFDYKPPGTEGKTLPCEMIPMDLIEGMPPDLATRADLMKIPAFADLDVDSCGNPCVWENDYEHRDCDAISDDEDSPEAPTWTDIWSCQVDSECPECGYDISPTESIWIGPEDPDLKELWDDLPEAGEAPDSSMDMSI